MNAKTKSALVLLGTLILGIVIGVLVQTTVHNQQVERARSLRDRGALSDVIERVVEPNSDQQVEAIRVIVGRFEAQLSELSRESWLMRSAIFDSMHEALVDSVLSGDQALALGEWRERNRRPSRRGNERGDGNRDGKIEQSDTN